MKCKCFVGNRWDSLLKFGYKPRSGDMFLYIHEQSHATGANLNEFTNDITPEITLSELIFQLEKKVHSANC